VAPILTEGIAEARQVFESLERIGIGFDCVTRQLLNEGMHKFIDPYDALLEAIAAKTRDRGSAPRLRRAGR
jgi:hypothetical protein